MPASPPDPAPDLRAGPPQDAGGASRREPGGAPASAPRKGVLGFFAAVMLLYLLPGAAAQSFSAPLGLAWTHLFVFLLPAWAASAGSNLVPRDFLLLSRRPAAGQVVLGLLLGAAAFPVANGIMALSAMVLPESWVREFDVSRLFEGPPLERASLALVATLLAPPCEEVAFRGYVQSALLTGRRPAAAIGLSALLFTAMHLDPVRFGALLPLGALFGWITWRAGSLWPAAAAHAANNAIASSLVLSAKVEPVPSAAEVRSALLLAVGGAVVVAFFASLYRRAPPAPPPPGSNLVRLDPADPSVRFRWFKVPPAHLALGALGLVLLMGLAAFVGAFPP